MDHAQRVTDSAFLQIIQYSSVATLKTLRLTSRSIYDLISAYEFSISRCIPRRELIEYAIQRFRPYHDCKMSLKSLFCIESRQRRARWLSDLVLQKYEERFERDVGMANDQARAHVGNGWAILWQMTDIANNVVANV